MPLERGFVNMDNLYLALDFPTGAEAIDFLKTHELTKASVKVGMELFYREGPDIIYKLKENGHNIFLDLKLCDIPNTVHQAMKNLASLEVNIVNVHATGGHEMIAQAKEGLLAGSKENTPHLIAVTVLTSFDEDAFQRDLKIKDRLSDYALHLAKVAKDAGADGVVCSVQEAGRIKEVCGKKFLTVTPGIRLANDDLGDQKRVATPRFARARGSDMIVVGRPITKAENPSLAYEQFIKEWTRGE